MDRPQLRHRGVVLLGLVLGAAVGTTAAPAVAAPLSAPPGRHAAALFEQRAETKWYEVKPAFQGQPEFLFAIAERLLGDGNRWQEIFDLNKGRVQPDGGSLTDPTRITAGWILVLPADAKGEGVQTGPLPTAGAPSPAPTNGGPAATGAPATAAPAAGPPAAEEDGGSAGLVVSIVIGLLALAGIGAGAWWFLRHRNAGGSAGAAALGATAKGGTSDAVPTRTFDTAAAWTIDRALQALVTGAEAVGRPVPPVYGVSLEESRVALRLAAPDEEPIEPWEAVENGRVWQASLRDVQSLPVDNDLAAPCPRLVTLGTAGGVRELIDLGQATGVISLQGDSAAARELVAAWTEELSSSPWAGGVQVVAGDIRPHLTGGERVSVRDALTLAEGEGADTAYTLRGGGAGADRRLGVLILGSAPGSRELERAQALVNRPDAAWVVIVLGQTRYDRWRFTVAADGQLDTGALGITVYTGSATAKAGR
ncbi:LysM peptidoglycan-binding domain-containing protein [Micromonospora sp. NPDC003197]